MIIHHDWPPRPRACSRCGFVKEPSEFHAHPATVDHLQSQCKACIRTLTRARMRRLRARRKAEMAGIETCEVGA